MPSDELVLRPGTATDLAQVSEVFLSARVSAVPAMPAIVHTPDETRAFYAALDLDDGRELWVAEEGARIVGFAELKGDWLDDLYVVPDRQRAGIGTALFELVSALRPGGFDLWVFESNLPARAFYRRRGCVELEVTDGSGNEERAPDVHVRWPGR